MANLLSMFEDASNIYRTKFYIVKQCIVLGYHDKLDNAVVSQDTYFKRNNVRDKIYEKVFKDKQNINGKRLPTTMQNRKYID